MGGGELDGEGKPVELGRDLGDNTQIRAPDVADRYVRPPLDEQPGRQIETKVRLGEQVGEKPMLSCDPPGRTFH